MLGVRSAGDARVQTQVFSTAPLTSQQTDYLPAVSAPSHAQSDLVVLCMAYVSGDFERGETDLLMPIYTSAADEMHNARGEWERGLTFRRDGDHHHTIKKLAQRFTLSDLCERKGMGMGERIA